MSFLAYQIKKLLAQRIMVKSTSRSDRHLLRNHLFKVNSLQMFERPLIRFTVNPPISVAALTKNHSNFFVALVSNLNKERAEIMCQNLFTGKIVQNVVEIII